MTPVTTHNLHEATAQDVFDTIIGHIKAQGRSSFDKGYCLYRSDDNLMCAAGCLIPDDQYSDEMEGQPWVELPQVYFFSERHRELIGRMQSAHDNNARYEDFMDRFLKRASEIAMTLNLEWRHIYDG